MKPVDLDELDRLHAAARNSCDISQMAAIYAAFPALSAELRTRRKQVEEARRALNRMRCIHHIQDCECWGACAENAVATLASIESAALASLESGEPRHE